MIAIIIAVTRPGKQTQSRAEWLPGWWKKVREYMNYMIKQRMLLCEMISGEYTHS